MEKNAETQDIRAALINDLNGWGGGLIVMGILHFVLSSVLWSEWGIVLIVIGLLCFTIRHRGMFIPLGLSLIFIGIQNGLGGLNTNAMYWAYFGGLQIYWGIKEIIKFSVYREKDETHTFQADVLVENVVGE
ncbi:MAG: hypothetical protein ACE5GN_00605 [Waddliaceae bacterium]